jgi:TatA/E family protein of Tat protein translocase
MFGLGVWEIALILVVALLVLGPDKLPDAAKSLGKALNDFRRAGDDIRREVMGENVPPAPVKPAAPPQTVANRVDPRMVDPAAPTSVADPATTVTEAQASVAPTTATEAQVPTENPPKV